MTDHLAVPAAQPATLVDLARSRALNQPDRVAYIFLRGDGQTEESLTYRALDRRARALAATLGQVVAPGERALLLFPPGLDYISAFFGCLYAGVVAVPAYPPNPARPERSLPRLRAIVADARPAVALTSTAFLSQLPTLFAQDPEFQALRWLAPPAWDADAGTDWAVPAIDSETLAFLQYTSGSTAAPKGVMLTHGNLLANLAVIARSFQHSPESRGMIWLPPYHDMGLIGGILQPLYAGFPVTLMAPATFLQAPVRWLQAISRTRATTSGGPNFAYDLCARTIAPEQRAGLDLSCWRVAFNGAEPVRHATLARFAVAFAGCGFRPEAFYPCYGLAEATLIVAGGALGTPPRARTYDERALERHAVVAAEPAAPRAWTGVSCGRPLPDHQIAIVDPQTLALCAPEQVGEIWVAGPSVAQGYWNRPAETRQTFQARTAGTGDTGFLRTGDLGFFDPEGLFITGRIKDLIIIRGRNYYPQDIEQVAEECHFALRPGCCAAFAIEIGGEERLVLACELQRQHRRANVAEIAGAIRRAVAEQHELQVYAVMLLKPGSIPKTTSGKLQRYACKTGYLAGGLDQVGSDTLEEGPAGVDDGALTRAALLACAPDDAPMLLERFLRGQLAQALRVSPESIDPDQPIAGFGLDSLAAIGMQQRIASALEVDIAPASLLDGSSIRRLRDDLLERLATSAAEDRIPRGEPQAEQPLSYGQRALWFLHQLAPDSPAYAIARAVRIPGGLDLGAFRAAFQHLVDRHPALRTTFATRLEEPVQRIHEHMQAGFYAEDARDWSQAQLDARLREAARRPFELAHGPPLRVWVFERAGPEALVLLAVHHLVSDFWSLAVLVNELGLLYRAEMDGGAATLPQLELTYADYAGWERVHIAGAAGERAWRYWRELLAGPLPPLNLPTDRPRPPVQTYNGATCSLSIGPVLAGRVKALGQARGATLFMTLLAAFEVLLHRYTGQRDIPLGAPAAGRDRPEVCNLVGYFVNPIVFRADCSGDPSFEQCLDQARRQTLAALEHQHYPFALLAEKLQPERDTSRSPIFQVMFTLQKAPPAQGLAIEALALNKPGVPIELPGGLRLETLALDQGTAQFDLALVMAELDGGLEAALQYNSDLFDPGTIERMLKHFHTLLEGIAGDPSRPVAALPLLGVAEAAQVLVAWNDTHVAGQGGGCLHQLVAAQAARNPDAIAVVYADRCLTYGALDARANQLARHLRSLGVQPGALAGIALERSVELVVGLLAILKAGGAYVPLDPAYPPDRLAFMLADARPVVLLTRQEIRDCRGTIYCASTISNLQSPSVIDLARDWPLIARQPLSAPVCTVGADDLAYVIYTSGSTGRPKGVCIPHGALANFLRAMGRAPGMRAQDTLLAVTTLSFDIAALEIFLPLAVGGRLVLASRAESLDGARLARLLAGCGATHMQATPATWRLLLEAGWPGDPRLTMLCGGEALPRALAERLLAGGGPLWNMYGPTETTIWSTTGRVVADDAVLSIGRLIDNTQIYLLDARLQPVPIGAIGELYIGGAGLARGYLGRPDLTAERFVPNPFSTTTDDRRPTTENQEPRTENRGQITGISVPVHPLTRSPAQDGGRWSVVGGRLYRTGDLARWLPDGRLECLGRSDQQVKVRGFRIEPGEIEAVLLRHPAIQECVVVAREDAPGGARLVAYLTEEPRTKNQEPTDQEPRTKNQEPTAEDSGSQFSVLGSGELRAFLKARLPDYMIPSAFVILGALPRTPNGKLDRRALPDPARSLPALDSAYAVPQSELERAIASIWQSVLRRERVGIHDNFFDLGGHSLLLAQVQARIKAAFAIDIPIVDLFRAPTISALASELARRQGRQPAIKLPQPANDSLPETYAPIAIIGMACRFPGAATIDAFWRNLCDGVESITFFSDHELAAEGIPPEVRNDRDYVKARAILDDIALFDADFFGFTPREAETLDPQHRIFLECAWAALEQAGYDSSAYPQRVGVYAGVGLNTYLLEADRARLEAGGRYQAFIGNDKDFVPTRVSYKLNLRGPSVNVQTACSSALAAVHLACQSLRGGECEIALAGGVSIGVPQRSGYRYEAGGIMSPDGHCRAFDARAQGTVFGSGAGVVVLKPLSAALADGDTIYAVIRGSALNNDGAQKVGYTAPGVEGQAAAIAEALRRAVIEPATVSYIEAHGTGTALGDPIEIAALNQVFTNESGARDSLALGSVKTNIGHLDTAAGIAGLIKTALALHHGQIPPSLHFEQPNPAIDFAGGRLYVNTQLAPWPANGLPRRAGVSSFGIGGTNAHVVLEAAPAVVPSPAAAGPQLLVLSAKTETALDAAGRNLVDHLRRHPGQEIADVAYTLQVGRKVFEHRRALVCHDRADAIALLEGQDPARVTNSHQEASAPPVVFMFPGQGAQYAGMGRDLYESEPVFRAVLDRCAGLLQAYLGLDIRDVLYADDRRPTTDNRRPEGAHPLTRSPAHPFSLDGGQWSVVGGRELDQTWFAQPALFAIEYALAQQWMAWGVRPAALIGHSVGELVAACLAGVFSLEDALMLVAARGQLMQALPQGAMLAVQLSETDLRPLLGDELDLAAVNGPAQCVVAGMAAAVDALEQRLAGRAIPYRRLHTSHAFHSRLVDPAIEPFAAVVGQVALQAPRIPLISNLSGTWARAEEITQPDYWARHLRELVRFGAGLQALPRDPAPVLLEVGPGHTLSASARQAGPVMAVASLRHARAQGHDCAHLLEAVGKLWLAGVQIDWAHMHGPGRRRVALPAYPFERQRYWIGPAQPAAASVRPAVPARHQDIEDWLYTPLWKQSVPPIMPPVAASPRHWLVFGDPCGLGRRIVERLAALDQTVTLVLPGEQFDRLDDRTYTLDPRCPAVYDALLRALDQPALDTIIDLWSIGDPAQNQEPPRGYPTENQESHVTRSPVYPFTRSGEPEGIEQALERGFYHLLHLAQALERCRLAERPLRIGIVSNAMHRIAGEAAVYPEQATLLGPCKVIPQEYPNITCQSIDIVLSGRSRLERLAEQVLAELAQPATDTLIAYRGMSRWIQTFEPLPRPRPAALPACLRRDGVYLITGGLGGIGFTLAEYLAGTVGARLVLVGRAAVPEGAERLAWQAAHAGQDATSRRLHRLEALESLGAQVLYISADVASHAEMCAALAQAYARFGAIHGVVHAAGLPGGGMIQLKTDAAAARVLAPKVAGTLVLAELFQGSELDFLVLCSSLNAITGGFGQVDYCAANAFLDAFAASGRLPETRVLAINWDRWEDVGMAIDTAAPAGFARLQQPGERPGPVHPLLHQRISATADRAIYHSTLNASEDWVLSEHRIAGRPTVPGTTYLEMARAALEDRLGAGPVVLSDVVFVAPLMLAAHESRQVVLILERAEEGYRFVVVSRQDAAGWQEHARGRARRLEAQPPERRPLEQIAARCRAVDLARLMQQSRAADTPFLEVGPRWDAVRAAAIGVNETLVHLELPPQFAADLERFKLHPALLDAATGIIQRFGEGSYLPLAYERLALFSPLRATIYSAITSSGPGGMDGEILTCDIALLGADGMVLGEISGFRMKRVGAEAAHNLSGASGTYQGGPHLEALLAESGGAGQGIAPRQGAEAFAAIVNGAALPSVVVSTHDLPVVMAHAKAMTRTYILDRLEPIRPPQHERPPIGSDFVAPTSDLEQRIAGIWQQVLGISAIGVHDNFFDLGGTSLSGIQLVAELKRELGIDIPAVGIFEAPTISALVKYVHPESNGAPALQKSITRAERKLQRKRH